MTTTTSTGRRLRRRCLRFRFRLLFSSFSSLADDLDVPEEARPSVPENALELVGDVLGVLVVRGDPGADEAERRRELVLKESFFFFRFRVFCFESLGVVCFLAAFSLSLFFLLRLLPSSLSLFLLTRMSTFTLSPSLLNSSEAA